MTKFNKNNILETIAVLDNIVNEIVVIQKEIDVYINLYVETHSKISIRALKSCFTDFYEMLNDLDTINRREFTNDVLDKKLLSIAYTIQNIRHEDAHDYNNNIIEEIEEIIEQKGYLFELLSVAHGYANDLIRDLSETSENKVEGFTM